MGCPPDPMEVSMWRSQDRTSEVLAKVNDLAGEIDSLEREFEGIFSLRDTNPLVQGLWERAAGRLARYDTEPPKADVRSGSFEEQLEATFQEERRSHKVAKAYERKLCTLRDFVLNAWRIPEVQSHLARLTDAVKALEQSHLEHRQEDRATWLAWLAEREDFYRYALSEKNPATAARYAEMLEKVRREMERVKALGDEQILLDCTLFGENPKDFDPLAD